MVLQEPEHVSPKTRSQYQSAPKLENRKTSPCSPCAPNLLHVLVSRIRGYHNLCSPEKNTAGKSVESVPRVLIIASICMRMHKFIHSKLNSSQYGSLSQYQSHKRIALYIIASTLHCLKMPQDYDTI